MKRQVVTSMGRGRGGLGLVARCRGAAGAGLMALLVGFVVGGLTSPGQTLLGGTVLGGMVNAVAPWLLAPFAVGSRAPRIGRAAWTGAVACVAQPAGYYLVAAARGYSASTGWVTVWCLAGIAGGVVFGIAGRSWRHSTGRWCGLGAALLVAAWLTEGVITFGVSLGYYADSVTFCAVAALLVWLLGGHHRQYLSILRWLLPAVTAGFLALSALPFVLSGV